MLTIRRILFWGSTALLLLAITAIAVPKLLGVEMRAVVSGSMEPELPVGSLVVIVPTPAEEIQVGDDISFVISGDEVVTHRVERIDREKGEFITRGVANAADAFDPPNRYDNIIGVVRFHLPVAGFVFMALSTTHGKIIAVTAIAAIYLLTTILSIWTKKPEVNEPDLDMTLETLLDEIGEETADDPVIWELLRRASI
ncbi:MAG: signal peptidase I [Oscillospiraceae bacterium]|jgi:signal peptidase I|nr:signal peptidase I [Oscillospiraceae bacterium]